jgi:hypothetical protein
MSSYVCMSVCEDSSPEGVIAMISSRLLFMGVSLSRARNHLSLYASLYHLSFTKPIYAHTVYTNKVICLLLHVWAELRHLQALYTTVSETQ